MTRALLFLSLSIAAAPLHAVPSIGGVQNNYSFLLEETPNHGIARGAIFILYGSEISGGGLLLGGFNPKLDKILGGVSISVTVNGVTTEAIPYYVSPGQIGAILPSATPAGQGTLTLTYAGETSAPYPILVVESAFGLMTMGGNGLGHAVVMDAGFTVLSPHNAPAAGQSVIFWGSGLGAFEGDETQLIAAPRSLEELPFELYIGGKLAETAYHGRSQFPALDQIVAKIPDGVAGCFVSVYIKTGGFVSNFTTMPVAAPGAKQCEDVFTNTQEVLGLSGRETVVAGWLQLGRFIGHAQGINGPTQLISDAATVQFLRYAPADFQNWGGLTLASMGSCVLSRRSCCRRLSSRRFWRGWRAGSFRSPRRAGRHRWSDKGLATTWPEPTSGPSCRCLCGSRARGTPTARPVGRWSGHVQRADYVAGGVLSKWNGGHHDDFPRPRLRDHLDGRRSRRERGGHGIVQ